MNPLVQPFEDFESASRAVLAYLHEQIGMGLWMMTRTEGDDWIILQTDDRFYALDEGSVLRWSDSYCSRMVNNEAPRFAPDAMGFSAYATAPINQTVQIGAYVGVPIQREDGTLFGTLCGISPDTQDEAITRQEPTVTLLARLLGTVLDRDLKAIDDQRRHERAQTEAHTDYLTGLNNRRGWESAVAQEELRTAHYGEPVGVLVIDLDGLKPVNDEQGHEAGDALIRGAAGALREAVRPNDVVARLGGDEFGVLAFNCNPNCIEGVVERVRAALEASEVSASIGSAIHYPARRFNQTVGEADGRMYADKFSRRDRTRNVAPG
ncbi:GGDEF domain-containing protein [Spiribacter vilamensis]|uniref:diguanylate cyclase n=1 Tax=Spiribacter vilamensis TaxID=531306 RepID=A0A4Q8CZD1_9GAMM|nr:GGDEF domain-containing protein [Spiribacter vilamensis]RZU98322.1 diguanylate cyclase (GGDEF)-like protein [Spiribacter vilamensis]